MRYFVEFPAAVLISPKRYLLFELIFVTEEIFDKIYFTHPLAQIVVVFYTMASACCVVSLKFFFLLRIEFKKQLGLLTRPKRSIKCPTIN